MTFDCFFWLPEEPLSEFVITREFLEEELKAERIYPVPGFVPTMMAGLRLLVDPSVVEFPPPKPNHWPPPGPKASVRGLIESVRRRCVSDEAAPFAELAAAGELDGGFSTLEDVAFTILDGAEHGAEFWDFWTFSRVLVQEMVEAPRAETTAKWAQYPAATYVRGSVDLMLKRPPLGDVLAVLERLSTKPAPHGVIMGWALES